MKYFQTYSANTLGGGGNQLYFRPDDPNKIETGRIFYRIAAGGTYRYSLLFSNIMDSTYSTGEISHMNLLCDQWTLVSAQVGFCAASNGAALSTALEQGGAQPDVENFQTLTFAGQTSKEVMPGEFFTSDPIELTFESGDYLCLEIAFRGNMIPCHQESILPVFRKTDAGWEYSPQVPFPGMIGCDRPVSRKVAFFGDSITQGIGTTRNGYAHWCAKVAEQMDSSIAFWNLGLGFARANDAASDGAWLFKVKQNELVVMCLGVNDLFRGFPVEQIKKDLERTLDKLHEAGCKVLLQSIPPCDLTDEKLEKWNELYRFGAETLAPKADSYFDVSTALSPSMETPEKSMYPLHPTDEGCARWADALAPVLRAAIDAL